MKPRIRTNTLTGFAELARSLGLVPADAMTAAGVDDRAVRRPDTWIAAAPVARLLESAASSSGRADFGLRMARLRRLGTLGPLAVVLREEPDLSSVLDLLVRYEGVYNEALRLRVEDGGAATSVLASLDFGEPVPHDQALDLVMATLVHLIRALMDPDWTPLSATFTRPSPGDPRPWEDLFGGDVHFGGRSTCLVLRTSDLRKPVMASDPSLRPYTQEFLRTTLAPQASGPGSPHDRLTETIELLLPLGRHSVDEVSARLGMRPRALQRRLAEEGETFSSVLHATRARIAERYLTNERYSLTDLSQVLGFGAPSAFSRWFRQQFGTTPTEWRRRHDDHGGGVDRHGGP